MYKWPVNFLVKEDLVSYISVFSLLILCTCMFWTPDQLLGIALVYIYKTTEYILHAGPHLMNPMLLTCQDLISI